MRTPFYIKNLTADLDTWIKNGWVNEASRSKIIAHAQRQNSGPNAGGALAILGVVLLGFAAISFVASNWAGMDKLMRMGVLLVSLWTAYAVTALALWRNQMIYVHAFGLLGAALFGAAIMLIAQSFNIQAHYPGGVLIWAIGAFATALILRSNPVLILASLLSGLWLFMSIIGKIPDTTQYWLFPILALSLGFSASKFKSSATINVLAISTLLYIPSLFEQILGLSLFKISLFFPALSAIYVAVALIAFRGSKFIFGANIFVSWMAIFALLIGFFLQFVFNEANWTLPEDITKWLAIMTVLMLVIIGLLIWLIRGQLLKPPFAVAILIGSAMIAYSLFLRSLLGELPLQMLYGAVFFGISIALLIRGITGHKKSLLWIGGISFTAQALYVYFETFKDLLNTSLFFLVGGLLLLFLSLLALRLSKQITKEAQS